MRRFDSRGFGLLEIIITSAVTMIIILASMSGLQYMNRILSISKSRSSASILGDAIHTQLMNRSSCLPSFKTKIDFSTKPTTASVQEVSLQMGPELLKSGVDLPQYGLRMRALQLRNFSLFSSLSGTDLYFADVSLQMSTPKLSSREVASVDDRFDFYPQTAARLVIEVVGGTAVGCYTVDSNIQINQFLANVCGKMGLDVDTQNQTCDLSGFLNLYLAKVGSCPSGQVMAGISAQGKADCRAIATGGRAPASTTSNGTRCGQGTYMVGLDGDGKAICSQAPVTADNPASPTPTPFAFQIPDGPFEGSNPDSKTDCVDPRTGQTFKNGYAYNAMGSATSMPCRVYCRMGHLSVSMFCKSNSK